MRREKVLEVKNLRKKIKNRLIIQDVSFSIDEGEIVGLIGNNGSGKTTIMKLITGLLRATSGEIYINKYSIKIQKRKALEYIGAVIEVPALYLHLTGYQNIKYFSRFYNDIKEERIEEIIDLLEMRSFINLKVSEYSLGMKQRLGIAVSMIHNPKLLILDEPINGVDSKGVMLLRKHLRDIAKKYGISILISSHILTELENICDRAILIEEGNVKDIVNVNKDISLELILNNVEEQ